MQVLAGCVRWCSFAKREQPLHLKLILGTERMEGAAASRPGPCSACIQDTNNICHPDLKKKKKKKHTKIFKNVLRSGVSETEAQQREKNFPGLSFLFLFFWPCCAACGFLAPRPGIEPAPLVLEMQSFNHGTTRKVPSLNF